MISREENSKRKSVRVDLPLNVQIDGQTYLVRNWSTTGIGIEDLAFTPQPGDILRGRVSFPLVESALSISVQLVYKGKRGDTFGFDFHEMSARHKRIFRHYIELSVEGKLDSIEDMVAIASAPGRHSPIELPLNAPELGSQGVLREFKRNSYFILAVTMAFVAAVAAVLFYNVVYKVEGTGFVSGNIERVTANFPGRVYKIMVQPNTFVDENTPLFAVENSALRTEIEALEQHVSQVAAEQGKPAAQVRLRAEAGLLASLKEEYQQRQVEYNNARHLFQQGIITQKELFMAANPFNTARSNYLKAVADGATVTESFAADDVLTKLKLDLAAKKLLLQRQLETQTVRAPRKGKIFQIDKAPGEYVSASDPVVLLESDVTPAVLLRLGNDDALKLRIGMPATIYVPFEDRKYEAAVGAIGMAAVSAAANTSAEGGMDQTLVRLEFVDKRVRLPVNARVNVWIRTPSTLKLL